MAAGRPGLGSALWPVGHWALIRQLAVHDLRGRTRDTWLGWGWMVAAPLLMTAVYTLVLREMLGVRWGGAAAGSGDGSPEALAFAVRLYAALAVFGFFSEQLMRAPRLLTDTPHLVKKVVFPLQTLPWVAVTAGLAPVAVAWLLLAGGALALQGGLPVTAVALPLVWLPLLPLVLGLGWLFSSVGAFVRDVADVLGLAMGALLFLCPVFYDASRAPAGLDWLMTFNPLAVAMTHTRGVLLDGRWPDWGLWGLHLGAALGVAVAGAWVFQRLRPGFADVV